MPVYEFHCSKCQKEFELLCPVSKANETASCPSCGAEAQKLVSAPATRLATWIKPPEKPFRQRTDKQS